MLQTQILSGNVKPSARLPTRIHTLARRVPQGKSGLKGTLSVRLGFPVHRMRRNHMSRGFPSMTALLGLLAVAGFQNRDKLAEMLGGASGNRTGLPGGAGQQPGGMGGLGGLLGGGGLGGLLGGLGGNASPGGLVSGGLGELINSFRQNGHGDTVDSWVGTGPNKEVAPDQLERAIDPDVLATLTQQIGLSREELLSRLSQELPKAVDQYTPNGRVPSDQEF
jgi:uncharacterized protein YidB (DUF937 family)